MERMELVQQAQHAAAAMRCASSTQQQLDAAANELTSAIDALGIPLEYMGMQAYLDAADALEPK